MNKDYLFFGCDWIMRPVVGYRRWVDAAKNLESELLALKTIRRADEGFWIFPFVIRVPSENALARFVENIGRQIGLVDWYPVSEQYAQQAIPFAQLAKNIEPSWLDGMMWHGARNEVLRERLDNQAKENMYYSFDWMLNSAKLPLFRDILAKTSELNCSLFRIQFIETEEGFHVQRFGIRVPFEIVLREFLNYIGEHIQITNVVSISEEDFYSGIKFAGVYGVEEFIQANQRNALENDELHRKLEN